MSKITLGTVSEGTHRTKDLIASFLEVVADHSPEELTKLLGEHVGNVDPEQDLDSWVDEDEERACYLLTALEYLLEEIAPPLCYFGALEGDGADFGFWLQADFVEVASEEPDAYAIAIVARGSNWLNGERLGADEQPHDALQPYVLEINDHGNATLYGPTRKDGTRDEVWGVV